MNHTYPFISEFLATMFLLLFGNGACMTVSLQKSFGEKGGWVVISFGWGFAVMFGAYIGYATGGQMNPAVTLAQIMLGNLSIQMGLLYMLAQFLGAFTGAVLAWIIYRNHFKYTEDKGAKLGVFATSSACNTPINSCISQIIGTFSLILPLLVLGKIGTLSPFAGPAIAGALVTVIGMATGGSEGYPINPARDWGPRFAHTILPIPGKGSSHWEYAWVPFVGPMVGAIVSVIVFLLLY